MNKRYPYAVIAALSLLAAVATWHPHGGAAPVVPQSETLEERAWLDHLPRSAQEPFNLYLFSNKKRGLFDRGESSFRHHLELYFFQAKNGRIRFRFPHDRRQVETTFTIEKVSPPVEGRFDLKLELKDDPMRSGTQVYYSSSEDRTAGLPADVVPVDVP